MDIDNDVIMNEKQQEKGNDEDKQIKKKKMKKNTNKEMMDVDIIDKKFSNFCDVDLFFK